MPDGLGSLIIKNLHLTQKETRMIRFHENRPGDYGTKETGIASIDVRGLSILKWALETLNILAQYIEGELSIFFLFDQLYCANQIIFKNIERLGAVLHKGPTSS